MYNIFYIYTYKYKTVKHAHALTHSTPYKPRTHKQPDEYTNKHRTQAMYIGQKCTSRIMHQAIQLAAYIYMRRF